MTVFPIEAVAGVTFAQAPDVQPASAPAARPAASFVRMLMDGVEQVDRKLIDAERLATTAVIDESIPPHQVMFALEEARQSFELMLQIRTRLVEGYQELLRMQL